ncbi:MAG: cupin domain-containing protein [Gammaproteobacteria bacterium]
MKNFQLHNVGEFNDLNQYVFAPEGSSIKIDGKLFLGDLLSLSSMEISLNKNAPGTGMNFKHRHKEHEEVYIFINGEGEMLIDDEIVKVKEGSIISMKPQANRTWWNTGSTDLTYIVLQAPEGGMKSPGINDGELLEGKVPWID